MRYLLAIVLPPVALFSVGKTFQAILCLVLMLTILGWPLAAIWALFVVNSSLADRRNQELIAEMQRQTAIQLEAARAQAKVAQEQAAAAQARAAEAEAQAQAARAQAEAGQARATAGNVEVREQDPS